MGGSFFFSGCGGAGAFSSGTTGSCFSGCGGVILIRPRSDLTRLLSTTSSSNFFLLIDLVELLRIGIKFLGSRIGILLPDFTAGLGVLVTDDSGVWVGVWAGDGVAEGWGVTGVDEPENIMNFNNKIHYKLQTKQACTTMKAVTIHQSISAF